MTDAEILYCNVKRLCRKRGVSMREAERKTGYCRGHLRQMATRGYRVNVEVIRYYAQMFGVPMVDLMEGMLDE